MRKRKKLNRSQIMSRIKGKDTAIEIIVRRWLFHHGFGYRKNYKLLPGHPDIALTKFKVAIFINGCFWHGHDNCVKYRLPKTNVDFWTNKITKNKSRDAKINVELNNLNWKVITLWECELLDDFDKQMVKLSNAINENRQL